jgi:hypothetical protein
VSLNHPNQSMMWCTVTTDENHQRADVPQDRQDHRRRRDWCWVAENHHDGRYEIEQEAIEHQEMGNPSLRVAEFAGGCNLFQNGPDRYGGGICPSLPRLRAVHRRRLTISPHGGHEIVLYFAVTGRTPYLCPADLDVNVA